VKKGSLFLFFSRFVPVTKRKRDDPKIDIENKYSRKHLNEGLYFIYGWFKVEEIIQHFEDIDKKIGDQGLRKELMEHHPHATKDYFKAHEEGKKKNAIYIAAEHLFDHSKDFPGCKYFPELRDEQLLTATDTAQAEMVSWRSSRWKLPPGFSLKTCCKFSPLADKKREGIWKDLQDGTHLVSTPRRWQEAAFEGTEESCDWFRGLLQRCTHERSG